MIDIYRLSNSESHVHFEMGIQRTDLGVLFDQKISKRLHFEVVASCLTFFRNWISIDIKERGVEGGEFGIVSIHSEENIFHLQDATCTLIWKTLLESIDELSYPNFMKYIGTTPYQFHISIFDFVKRSRFGYFMEYMPYLENRFRTKYPDIMFSVRLKDDTQYYYLIFATEDDWKYAEQKYGIVNINRFAWSVCKEQDFYHVFDQPLPLPDVVTKQQIINSGRAMEFMRNNPDFTGLL